MIAVHLLAQRRDIRNELHVPPGLQIFGELVDAIVAVRQFLAAALESRHDAGAGYVLRRRLVVEQPGKSGNVRGVGSDDSEAQIGR